MYKREYWDTEPDARKFAKSLSPFKWEIIEVSEWHNGKWAVEYQKKREVNLIGHEEERSRWILG